MQQQFIGKKIIYFESIDNTNTYILERLKNGDIESGTIVFTDHQLSGRGQRNKKWETEAFANLSITIAADLDEWKINKMISLNHIIGLAVHKFFKSFIGKVHIKWPNDIMLNDKKAAGILIENIISSTQKKSAIGIGININQTIFITERATSLFLATGVQYVPKNLLYVLIDALNFYLYMYQQKGERHIFQLFNNNLWKLNESWYFTETESKINYTGEICSTTMQGELLVSKNNKTVKYRNGEVSY